MAKRNSKNKILYKIIPFLLIIVGVIVITNKYYNTFQISKIEQRKIDEFMNHQNNIEVITDIEQEQDVPVIDEIEKPSIENANNYIAVLEIPKIKLRKGLYSKTSIENDVSQNIEILEESTMPDTVYSNLILAAHAGSGRIAYFKNLNKLSNGDIATIYYAGFKYDYRLINSYEIEKTGKANIIRNGQKKNLTLITCKHGTNKQVIYIFELEGENE